MTGLRIAPQLGVLGKRLERLKRTMSASEFKPELATYAKRTLEDCVRTTPVRSEAIITKAQATQYDHRVNYIPSVHTLHNPTLIVNDTGEHWIYVNEKWYNGEWHLPDEVYAAYQELLIERERRMQTSRSEFINERKQARFLYRRSWYQVAQSLGLALSVGAAIINSRTRKKPPKEPPKAYGQWRGGAKVLSVVIRNVFLDIRTKYWNGNGKQILAQAQAKNRAAFIKACSDKAKREISAARQIR